ncbi:hypothetical protein Sjap_007338 [Stephania japonica]|uniref:Uncharacterized protein n=1 Tax=Stephania japonica TaxID=461633 RepID=A0AAP0JN19_9MAGN
MPFSWICFYDRGSGEEEIYYGSSYDISEFKCDRSEKCSRSGGFEDSENELRSARASSVPRDLHNHDQRRKGNSNGDKWKMKTRGEGSRSLFHLVKSVFRREV